MNHNIETVGNCSVNRLPLASRPASALIGAGVLTGVMASPAYAATLVTADQVQPLLLIGSGILLVVALALKAVNKRNEHDVATDPDITHVNMTPQSTGTIGDYRISRPWNR